MSDSNNIIKLGNASFTLGIVERTVRKHEKDPANPSKKKVVEARADYGAPVATADGSAFTIDTIASLFDGLIHEAEKSKAGGGLALAGHLLNEHLADAYVDAHVGPNGAFSEEAYRENLISVTAVRSKGVTIKAIDEELRLLGVEIVPLVKVSSSPDAWATLKTESGEQQFKSQAEYALRLTNVLQRIESLGEQRAKKAADAAERAAKVKATKAAKAAAPAPAAA